MGDPGAERDARIARMAVTFCNDRPPIINEQEALYRKMYLAMTDADAAELRDVEQAWDAAVDQAQRAALAGRINAVAIRLRAGEGVLDGEMRPHIRADVGQMWQRISKRYWLP